MNLYFAVNFYNYETRNRKQKEKQKRKECGTTAIEQQFPSPRAKNDLFNACLVCYL